MLLLLELELRKLWLRRFGDLATALFAILSPVQVYLSSSSLDPLRRALCLLRLEHVAVAPLEVLRVDQVNFLLLEQHALPEVYDVGVRVTIERGGGLRKELTLSIKDLLRINPLDTLDVV